MSDVLGPTLQLSKPVIPLLQLWSNLLFSIIHI